MTDRRLVEKAAKAILDASNTVQGEPTDAQVEAAAQAVHHHIWPGESWDDMPDQYQVDILAQERAALRAAFATNQEENR